MRRLCLTKGVCRNIVRLSLCLCVMLNLFQHPSRMYFFVYFSDPGSSADEL